VSQSNTSVVYDDVLSIHCCTAQHPAVDITVSTCTRPALSYLQHFFMPCRCWQAYCWLWLRIVVPLVVQGIAIQLTGNHC
jgi:hypothetical protein